MVLIVVKMKFQAIFQVNLQLLNPQIYLKTSLGLWRFDQPFSFSRNLLGTGWSGGYNLRKSQISQYLQLSMKFIWVQMAGDIALVSSWRVITRFPSDLQSFTRISPGTEFSVLREHAVCIDLLIIKIVINTLYFLDVLITGFISYGSQTIDIVVWWLQYKFIVDGEWRHDEQQAHMPDNHGHVNNWLLITRQPHHILPPTPDLGTPGVTMDVDHEMVHHVVSTLLWVEAEW